MVDSIIKDLTRLAARRLVLNAAVGLGLGGFQHGGSFQVGGSGGPDSQLVAFRATPNERVTIETPSQQRQGSPTPSSTSTPPQVTIINTITATQFRDAMDTPEGQDAIANIIGSNPRRFRSILSRG